jgi:DNA-binding GntR family transcriptional regulator
VDALFARAASEDEDKEFIFAVHKYHVDLHMKIAVYARSESLRAAIEKSHVLIYNWLFDTASGRRTLPPGFHEELIISITGDPQEAESAMRKHVRFGFDGVLRAIEPKINHRWRL